MKNWKKKCRGRSPSSNRSYLGVKNIQEGCIISMISNNALEGFHINSCEYKEDLVHLKSEVKHWKKMSLNTDDDKSYLRSKLKKLSHETEDERVEKILKRIDKRLAPKYPQRPGNKNWERAHKGTPASSSQTPK
ncbi:hypothetical protein Glove_208g126 [Diversispora epigaea]|uniref:Uncharacterized protein n=1 Tax=Diversispora epigaea TaxID=1348612 RepID=A0A397IQ68_9GLOM|nr:hypothetical protein Glove_208g126 [Diversispora epigaea]